MGRVYKRGHWDNYNRMKHLRLARDEFYTGLRADVRADMARQQAVLRKVVRMIRSDFGRPAAELECGHIEPLSPVMLRKVVSYGKGRSTLICHKCTAAKENAQ